jgi:hypothetical protein
MDEADPPHEDHPPRARLDAGRIRGAVSDTGRTLRDWEQAAKEPDQAARAYLRAIAGDAAAVQRALEATPRQHPTTP